jgi:hypothetical protein
MMFTAIFLDSSCRADQSEDADSGLQHDRPLLEGRDI